MPAHTAGLVELGVLRRLRLMSERLLQPTSKMYPFVCEPVACQNQHLPLASKTIADARTACVSKSAMQAGHACMLRGIIMPATHPMPRKILLMPLRITALQWPQQWRMDDPDSMTHSRERAHTHQFQQAA